MMTLWFLRAEKEKEGRKGTAKEKGEEEVGALVSIVTNAQSFHGGGAARERRSEIDLLCFLDH